MKKSSFFLLLIISTTLIGCRMWGVRGNGNITMQEREIADFNKLEVSGIFNVKVKVENKTSIQIRAEENLMKYISADVEGSVLRLYAKKNLSPKRKILVKISTKSLNAIESSGVTKIYGLGIDSETFDVDVSGASSLYLKGNTNTFNIDISGASKLDASDFIANDVIVDVSGASNATVFAKENIRGDASGASSVRYLGNPPNVKFDVSGVSSFKKKN